MSPALTYAMLGAAAASLAVLFFLFQKHIDGRPLLAYEPRQIPPWNFAAPALILTPLVLSVSTSLLQPAAIDPNFEIAAFTSAAQLAGVGASPSASYGVSLARAMSVEINESLVKSDSLPRLLIQNASISIMLAVACYMLLSLVYGATRHDLGLPCGVMQLLKDIGAGIAAFAACLAPIYLLLFALNTMFPNDQGHPLIHELMANHSPAMMLAAAFTAVVAAPLYEETAFRLVLQGWLERRQMLVGRAETARIDAPADASPHSGSTTEPLGMHFEGVHAAKPNWLPIAISGTLFGLAHTGQGLSPAPLILLGVLLGYIYQRTHRVVPCIVCHMLFNGYTFLMLSLQFSSR